MNLSGKNKTGIKKEKEPYPRVGRLCQVGPPTHQAQPRLLLARRVTDRWAPLDRPAPGASLYLHTHLLPGWMTGGASRSAPPLPSPVAV
jgi:hypothetical protein